ncbi:MAG: sulfatase-like hydrolase/transferase, partial [Chitinophagaceae bacterium]
NHSMFDFCGLKKTILHYYLPPIRDVLTFQTFTNKLQREIGYNFKNLFKKPIKFKGEYLLYDNNLIDSLTRHSALTRSNAPKFVYSHFLMPHPPFAFNEDGNPFYDIKRVRSFAEAQTEYVQYLKYTNKKIISLIDYIIKFSNPKPIIMLISDHGYREIPSEFESTYSFMNLSSIYLPDGDYLNFYSSMSNVNLFRTLLNVKFGQKIPLLIDSLSFIK